MVDIANHSVIREFTQSRKVVTSPSEARPRAIVNDTGDEELQVGVFLSDINDTVKQLCVL